jgi:hypothetical protein
MKKIRFAAAVLLILAFIFPLAAEAAPGDEVILGSVEANNMRIMLPEDGSPITFADRFPVGSTPMFYLHFNLNVTDSSYFYGNLGKIHLYDSYHYEMLFNYRTAENNGIIGISPGITLSSGEYSIVVEEGILAGHNDVRVSSKSYTIFFLVGDADVAEPPDPDADTWLVTFDVSGVYGTPFSVSVQDTYTGKRYNSTSGYLDLPDGNYHYAVSASGYTTAQGDFTVSGSELWIPVYMSDKVTVTFVTTPSDATMTLKMGQNDFVDPVSSKVYSVQPGLEYTYVVMRDGYIVGSSRFTPIANMTVTVILDLGQDGQGNGGNTLTMLSPSDITLGAESGYYYNTINTKYEVNTDIVFGFTMGAGVNNLNEQSFIADRLPLIQVYDRYPGGHAVSGLTYLSFANQNQMISIKITEKLPAGTYCLVFGRDVCGNNPNKTLGMDIAFQFVIGDPSVVVPGDDGDDGELPPITAGYHLVMFDSAYGSAVRPQIVVKGETADMPADPVREGYEFSGWYLNGVPYDFSSAVTADIILVAGWTDKATGEEEIIKTTDGALPEGFFLVLFDSTGGTTVSPQIVDEGGKVAEPDDPEWENYAFAGWYLDGDPYDFSKSVYKNITLVARWLDESGALVPLNSGSVRLTVVSFKDLIPNAWYIGAISFVLERGLFVGTSSTEFSPDAPMDRGMFVTVLGRLARVNSETVVAAKLPFSDVGSNDYFALNLAWAYQNGLAGGYPDGSFGPGRGVSRQEVIVLLHRYATLMGFDTSYTDTGKLGVYTDVSHIWAREEMNWAANIGLINGKSATTLNPDDTTTRAEVAALIQRFTGMFMEQK